MWEVRVTTNPPKNCMPRRQYTNMTTSKTSDEWATSTMDCMIVDSSTCRTRPEWKMEERVGQFRFSFKQRSAE